MLFFYSKELLDDTYPHDIESKESNNDIVMVPCHDAYVDSGRSNTEDQVTSPDTNLMHIDPHTEHDLTSDALTDDNDTTNSKNFDNVSPAEYGTWKSKTGRHWRPPDRYK